MRLRAFGILLASGLAAASSWSFEDASLRVQEMRGSELGAKKEQVTHTTSGHSTDKSSLSPQVPLKDAVRLNPSGSVRLSLTVTNGGKPRKPHQAFLTLTSDTGLEESFPMTLSDNGRAKFDLVSPASDAPSAI
jgi:oligosaccharyltransferase complex subunit delta (ribophorin II)